MLGAAALAAAAAAVLLWLAWPQRQRRAWALLTVAGTALYLALRDLPLLLPGPKLVGEHWNWSGHILALAAMLMLAMLLARRAGLDARSLGLARPTAAAAATAVTAAALLLSALANRMTGIRVDDVPAETWWFLATMPGLAEEVAFRGVLLAAAERAAPAARRIAGASLSAGGIVLTLAFVSLHGLSAGTLLSVLPAALLYLWLRHKTSCVLVPIVAHNLFNLTVIAAHL